MSGGGDEHKPAEDWQATFWSARSRLVLPESGEGPQSKIAGQSQRQGGSSIEKEDKIEV